MFDMMLSFDVDGDFIHESTDECRLERWAKNLRQLLTDGLQPVFRHSGDNDWQLVKGEIGMLRMPAACHSTDPNCFVVSQIFDA
jgi:hypothetical protein